MQKDARNSILAKLMITKLRLTHAVLTMDADYPKDPDPKNWRTIEGSHVHLTNGKIDGGAGGKFSGHTWTGREKHSFIGPKLPGQMEGAPVEGWRNASVPKPPKPAPLPKPEPKPDSKVESKQKIKLEDINKLIEKLKQTRKLYQLNRRPDLRDKLHDEIFDIQYHRIKPITNPDDYK
jgi:hypothetical protein